MEYDWDELEQLYFGSEYKQLSPLEKLTKIVADLPLDEYQRELANRSISMMTPEETTRMYKDFIVASESLETSLKTLRESFTKNYKYCTPIKKA